MFDQDISIYKLNEKYKAKMWVAKYKYTKGNVKFDGLESLEEVGFATFGHKLDFK